MAQVAHSGSEKGKIVRIGRKVGNLVAVMLGVTIILVVMLCVLMFYRLTMSMMQNECVSGTNVLAYELSNYSGDEDKTALLDALKKQMGCEFTIFHGDERAESRGDPPFQRGGRDRSEPGQKLCGKDHNPGGRTPLLLCAHL